MEVDVVSEVEFLGDAHGGVAHAGTVFDGAPDWGANGLNPKTGPPVTIGSGHPGGEHMAQQFMKTRRGLSAATRPRRADGLVFPSPEG